MIPILFAFFMAAACGYALIYGDRSARSVAATVLVGSVLTVLVISPAGRWQGKEPGVFAIDLVMLLIFGAIMLRSTHFWPIWTTAAQLLSVLAHLGPVLRRADIAVPFAVGEQIWSWFILAQLIVVTASRQRAMKRRR